MTHTHTIDFWISAWQHAAEGSSFRKAYPDETRCWNNSARSYDEGMGKSNLRVSRVMDTLDQLCFWEGKQKRILDIGSGTGSFTIPLAKCGAIVDALDSSAEMNSILCKKYSDAHLDTIKIITQDFNKFDLPQESYDCVLGSMNPCLYQPDNFLKMLSLTRDMLVYIGVAQPNTTSDELSLTQLLTGKSIGHNGSNLVVYPLGILSAMGLHPAVETVLCKWKNIELPQQAQTRFLQQYADIIKGNHNAEEIINGYIASHTQKGVFIEYNTCQMGIVVCRKQTLSL